MRLNAHLAPMFSIRNVERQEFGTDTTVRWYSHLFRTNLSSVQNNRNSAHGRWGPPPGDGRDHAGMRRIINMIWSAYRFYGPIGRVAFSNAVQRKSRVRPHL